MITLTHFLARFPHPGFGATAKSIYERRSRAKKRGPIRPASRLSTLREGERGADDLVESSARVPVGGLFSPPIAGGTSENRSILPRARVMNLD